MNLRKKKVKICLGGGIGRHAGLKILWTVMSVPVRPRPEVHKRGVKRKLLRAQSTDCLGRDLDAGSALNR